MEEIRVQNRVALVAVCFIAMPDGEVECRRLKLSVLSLSRLPVVIY